jgi:hypothetical protein
VGFTFLKLNVQRPDPPKKVDARPIFNQEFDPVTGHFENELMRRKIHAAVSPRLPSGQLTTFDVVCAVRSAFEAGALEPEEWVEVLTGFGTACRSAGADIKCRT